MKVFNTEEKIMGAALREFSEFGLEGARIDRIAKKARVNKAMIYYHFRGKEALYEKILSGVYSRIRDSVINNPPEGESPGDIINSLLSNYVDFVTGVENEYIRLMIREFAAGGKYFRKIAIPGLVLPILDFAGRIFEEGRKNDQFAGLDTYYTFIQIVGAVVFSRFVKNAIEGTETGKMIFRDDYREKYKANLLAILHSGMYQTGREHET